jgi:uncharacterized protein (TIGR00730 family)
MNTVLNNSNAIGSVCVYCSSSSKLDNVYYEAASRVGTILAEARISLVFGGGKAGLMGAMADSLLAHDGEAVGVIPRFMCEEGWQHTGLSELKIVETMHERKALMAQLADAAIALPGGIGTFDELFEIITWKQLGLFSKPVVILNTNRYFDHIIAMLQTAADQNFLRDVHHQIWNIVDTPEEILPAILNSSEWPDNARSFAAI